MKNNFTRARLEAGMIVQCRNGARFKVPNRVKHSNSSDITTLDRSDTIDLLAYDEGLEHCDNHEFDIVEVRCTDNIARTFKKFSNRRFSGDGIYDLPDVSNLFGQYIVGQGYSELKLVWREGCVEQA